VELAALAQGGAPVDGARRRAAASGNMTRARRPAFGPPRVEAGREACWPEVGRRVIARVSIIAARGAGGAQHIEERMR
ncbi:MAG: hypothetical protein MUE62_12180, partial [Burkholderiaceae bacterium]|nr:hypothetical protein [Burkholderiaceae bacterium]